MSVLGVVSLAIFAILLVGVLFLILIVAAIPGVLAKRHGPLGSPPRQKPASFSLDQVMQKLTSPQNGANCIAWPPLSAREKGGIPSLLTVTSPEFQGQYHQISKLIHQASGRSASVENFFREPISDHEIVLTRSGRSVGKWYSDRGVLDFVVSFRSKGSRKCLQKESPFPILLSSSSAD
jgi:hypothetical protein